MPWTPASATSTVTAGGNAPTRSRASTGARSRRVLTGRGRRWMRRRWRGLIMRSVRCRRCGQESETVMALSFVNDGKHVALYDTVTDWAFGPVFGSETAAKRFLDWAEDQGV